MVVVRRPWLRRRVDGVLCSAEGGVVVQYVQWCVSANPYVSKRCGGEQEWLLRVVWGAVLIADRHFTFSIIPSVLACSDTLAFSKPEVTVAVDVRNAAYTARGRV